MSDKLQIAAINTNNFLRWYPNTTATVDNSTYTTGLHNGYLYRWRTHPDMLPILVGDTFTMYTNFDTDYLTGRTIGIVEEDSCGVYTIISDTNKYVISSEAWGTNNAKITLTIPVTNLTNNKSFRLALITGGTTVDYVSNYFVVKQRTALNINATHLISFYHNSNVYNYDWSIFEVGVSDPYQVRLASSVVEVSYPSEKEIYKEATSGKPRITRAINNKQFGFEVYFNTEEAHDTVSTISNFKYLEINGREYVAEEYEVSYNRNFNLFKGVLTLKDSEFDRRVNVCS